MQGKYLNGPVFLNSAQKQDIPFFNLPYSGSNERYKDSRSPKRLGGSPKRRIQSGLKRNAASFERLFYKQNGYGNLNTPFRKNNERLYTETAPLSANSAAKVDVLYFQNRINEYKSKRQAGVNPYDQPK